MELVLLLVHDPLENLSRHLKTVKFDADVWASMLSLDLLRKLSVLKQNDFHAFEDHNLGVWASMKAKASGRLDVYTQGKQESDC